MKKIIFALLFLSRILGYSQTRPNVIWLDLEDLSPIFAAYGDSTIETPNIDRLAREGIVFKKAFTTTPVCAPTRASIITGTFPTRIGAHNMRITAISPHSNVPAYEVVPPVNVRCFPDILRENGIYTISSRKTDYQFSPSPFTWDVYPANDSTDRYKFPKDKPFFKQINFIETHESQIWGRGRQTLSLKVDTSRVVVPPYLPQTEITKLDWATQYNNLLHVDSLIGGILDTLENQGLLDNTLIIFSGDHGNGLPRSKRSVHHSGVHVPLIIRYPDKRLAGTVNNELVYLFDLGPTILSYYNIAVPSYMDGRDIAGKQQLSESRKYVFFSADRFDETVDLIRAVSDGRYKYIRNYQPHKKQFLDLTYRKSQQGVKELNRLDSLGLLNETQAAVMRKTKPAEELYDTHTDPHEITDLSNKSEWNAQLSELRAALDGWLRVTKDLGFTNEMDIAKSFWPNLVQPVTEKPTIKNTKNKFSLSSATKGATVGYKTSKANKWIIYTKPFELKNGDSLYVAAHRLGWKTSETIALKNGKQKWSTKN